MKFGARERLEEKSIARVSASDTVRVDGHRASGGHVARDRSIMSAIGAGTKGDTSGARRSGVRSRSGVRKGGVATVIARSAAGENA